jgi:hypothetical protein
MIDCVGHNNLSFDRSENSADARINISIVISNQADFFRRYLSLSKGRNDKGQQRSQL